MFKAETGAGCTHVGFIPLAVGSSIDQNNGALDECVRTDKLIVRSIVDLALMFTDLSELQKHDTYDTDNPRLLCDMLRCPCKITRFKTEGTELCVATPCANGMDPLCTKLSVSWLTAEFELSLFAVVGALGAGC